MHSFILAINYAACVSRRHSSRESSPDRFLRIIPEIIPELNRKMQSLKKHAPEIALHSALSKADKSHHAAKIRRVARDKESSER